MLEWLRDNASLVSTLVTLGTLLVWLIWLQLMYSDFRGRRQPRMLLHQTHGAGPESRCLLVNLSQGVIHIQCVRAAFVGEEEESSLPLGSPVSIDRELEGAELENLLRQGPLAEGEFLQLGSFEEILERLADRTPPGGRNWLSGELASSVQLLEIRVAAVYGNSDRSVGARRKFRLESHEGTLRVKAHDTYTEQLYSRSQRRIAEQWLRQCLDE